MKYLKSIFEELNPNTYISAAKKLRKINHKQRADELTNWAEISKWKQNIEAFSKFGEIEVLVEGKLGRFYVFLTLDILSLEDSLLDVEDTGSGYLWFPIGLIPKDNESLEICKQNMIDSDFYNGFFWSFSLSIDFDLKEEIKYTDIQFSAYDNSLTGDVKVANRKSANTLKKIIVNAIGNPNYNYPSDYSEYNNMYELLDYKLGASLRFVDYGFTPEDLANYIKKSSVNIFYN